MGRTPYTNEDFARALRRAVWRLKKYGPLRPEVETRKNPCQFILTGKHNSNGRVLNVRCYCMAPYGAGPRFFAYDTIARVSNIQDAVAAWKQHRAEVA